MPQPLVYVVILNWNLKQDTQECLASLLESTYSNFRALVVDNGSQDGSPEYLRERFPNAEVIVNPANLGFAGGNNVGLRHALDHGADYVLLLNNDTVVDAAMLSRLVARGESDHGAGIIAPMMLYYAQRKRIWHLGGRVSRWLPVAMTLGHSQRDDGHWVEPFAVDYVVFCGALLKRGLLEAIGLLDERFFFTYEDSDFCSRARAAGYRILCEPRARLWHKVSLSAQKDSVNVRYWKSKDRAMFYRLHPHGPHPWLTAAYLWLNTLAVALAGVLRGDPAWARAAVRGLRDGYRERLEIA